MTRHTSPKAALRRYHRHLGIAMVAYVVSLFAVITVVERTEPALPLAVALAALPALAVVGALWAVWTYLREMDEVARHFTTRSMVFGAFAVLAVSGTWGLLEMIVEELPRIGIFWALPIFFAAMGVSLCFGPGGFGRGASR